jgi:hypothetical protein
MRNFLAFLLIVPVLWLGWGIRLEAIQHSDPYSTSSDPFVDDAFYYFSLGENLSHGQPRVDAEHNTTGFQPLWGFLVALPYFVSSDVEAVFNVQLLGAFLGLLTCALIYRLTWSVTKSPWAGLVNAGLWIAAPQTVVHNIGGMETGLAVLTQVLMLTCLYMLYTRRGVFWWKACGFACGLGFLARIDTSFLILGILIPLVLFTPRARSIRDRVRPLTAWGVFALIPLAPWSLFTLSMGKTPLPESGQAVTTLMHNLGGNPPPPINLSAFLEKDPVFVDFFQPKLISFLNHIVHQVYAVAAVPVQNPDQPVYGDFTNLMLVVFKLGLIAILFSAASKSAPLRAFSCAYMVWVLGMIPAYSLVIIVGYFYDRYALPLAEIFSILLLLMILKAASLAWERTRIVGALAVLLIAFYSAHTLKSYYTDYYDNPRFSWITSGESQLPNNAIHLAVEWMDTNLPPSARVGAFQSGYVGYYSDTQVINLDGKVNHDAHEAMVDHRMWRYICEADLDYIVDWPIQIYYYLIYLEENWQDDNLIELNMVSGEVSDPTGIYQVNRENCPWASNS